VEPDIVLARRYRLDRILGAGGMGEVWHGRDVQLGREVAVKLMRAGDSSPVAFERFRREAAIAASLEHPGITMVHDFGHHDGRLFIVTELLRGHELGSLIAAHPGGLPLPQVLDLGVQLADALAAAHGQGIVHRDLKPSNLFVLLDGRLKVCDFGLARDLNAASTITRPGEVFGTAMYMAPEQWLGKPTAPGIDLYSLGCILHEMLTGRLVFAGPTPPAYMTQHLTMAPVPPQVRNPSVPSDLNDLVAALLAKDPAIRPASALVVRDTLAAMRERAVQRAVAAMAAVAPAGTAVAAPSGPRLTMPSGPLWAAPVACAGAQWFYAFHVSAAGRLTHHVLNQDTWSPPLLVPGTPPGRVTSVAAISWPAIAPVIAIVADGLPYASLEWGGWQALCDQGEPVPLRLPVTQVAVSRRPSEHGLSVLALDGAGRLWARSWDGIGWSGWAETASPVSGQVSAMAIAPSNGILDIVATADGRACFRSGLLQPTTLDVGRPVVDVAYAAAASSPALMHACVFALDDGGTIFHLWDWWHEGGHEQSGWTALAGPGATAPPGPGGRVTGISADRLADGAGILLAATADGRLHCAGYVLGPAGRPEWSPWRAL
jgi:hypothetical protein